MLFKSPFRKGGFRGISWCFNGLEKSPLPPFTKGGNVQGFRSASIQHLVPLQRDNQHRGASPVLRSTLLRRMDRFETKLREDRDDNLIVLQDTGFAEQP